MQLCEIQSTLHNEKVIIVQRTERRKNVHQLEFYSEWAKRRTKAKLNFFCTHQFFFLYLKKKKLYFQSVAIEHARELTKKITNMHDMKIKFEMVVLSITNNKIDKNFIICVVFKHAKVDEAIFFLVLVTFFSVFPYAFQIVNKETLHLAEGRQTNN